ncbi:hypothetical protein [Aquimarina algiphila]|uniref:hypothetical protein n=1 Tax=Aquimarina algiphila TaxID=2047982 RepID=UPI00232C9D44|nr:hypothetical protein [Aquimarina algiphila]
MSKLISYDNLNYEMNKLINSILILVIVCTLIKLFLIILIPKGDSSVFLGVKFNPLQENIIYQYDNEIDGEYLIIQINEMQLIGENTLRFIFKTPHLIYISFLGLLLILKFKFLKNKSTL